MTVENVLSVKIKWTPEKRLHVQVVLTQIHRKSVKCNILA